MRKKSLKHNTSFEILKSLIEEIDFTEYLNYQDLLEALYQTTRNRLKKTRSKNYSYLEFAADLGFGRTNVLRLIITNKRILSVKNADKISTSLNLKKDQYDYLLNLIKYQKNSTDSITQELAFSKLTSIRAKQDQDSKAKMLNLYFQDWHTPVIKEIITANKKPINIQQIQKSLSIPIKLNLIRKSLIILESLNLIKKDNDEYIAIESQHISSGDTPSQINLIHYHIKMLELAKNSLSATKSKRRDYQSLSFSIPEDIIPKLKERIQALIAETLAYENIFKDKSTQVFQLNIQLFPLTKGDSNES